MNKLFGFCLVCLFCVGLMSAQAFAQENEGGAAAESGQGQATAPEPSSPAPQPEAPAEAQPEEESAPFQFKTPEEPALLDQPVYEGRIGQMTMQPGDISLEFKVGPGFKVSQYGFHLKGGLETNVRLASFLDLGFPIFFGGNFNDFGLVQLTPGVRFVFPMMLNPVQMNGFVIVGAGAYVPIVDSEIPFTDIGMRVGVGSDLFFSRYAAFTFEVLFNQIVTGVDKNFKFLNRTNDGGDYFKDLSNYPPATLDIFLGVKYIFSDKKIEKMTDE